MQTKRNANQDETRTYLSCAAEQRIHQPTWEHRHSLIMGKVIRSSMRLAAPA
jgi:hypothetical protein